MKPSPLVEVNPDMLVQVVERMCQGWSFQGLLMSVVSIFLGKESFPINLPNQILKYVVRQHCIYNRVDNISLIKNA